MIEILAQATPIKNRALPTEMQSLTDEQFLGNSISAFVGIVLIVGTIAAFLMLLISGIQFLLSGGDKAGTEAAKNRITTSLIGLVLLFSAWALIKLIETFLGITIITGPFRIPTITQP